jgi:flagella basal body P-ring formation protein FlgA
MRQAKIYISFLLLFLSGHVYANSQELDAMYIEQLATAYLTEQFPSSNEEKVLISVSSLDPRIEIKSCGVPLLVNIPEKNNTRNVNLKISCNDTASWKIYLSAKIQITKAILVATSTINKGDMLNKDNVALNYLPVNQIRGDKLSDTALVFGAKAKKRIAQGRAISKTSFCLVCKGDFVTIIAASDGFSIKTQGMALSSGNVNDQIRVRNSRSNKVITPRVKNEQQVVVNL